MNKPKRQCGSYEFWIKWKFDDRGRGLGEELDVARTAQEGNNCPDWKGKSYKRDKNARMVQW